jgi:phage shock protein A
VFKRLWMVIRSWFGFFIGKAENPELMLNQMVEDMKAKLVEMRNNAVGVIAAEKQLMQSVEASQKKLADLDNQIRLAVRAGKDDLAAQLIAMKNSEQATLNDLQNQLTQAHAASEQAKKMIQQYEVQVQKAMNEKVQLIAANKRAAMQEQLAKTMQNFSVAGEFDTLENMRQKIKERQAHADAMLELGNSTVQSQVSSLQQDTASVEVQAQLLEYKKQLGVLPQNVSLPEETGASSPQASQPQKTMEPLKIEEKPPGPGT